MHQTAYKKNDSATAKTVLLQLKVSKEQGGLHAVPEEQIHNMALLLYADQAHPATGSATKLGLQQPNCTARAAAGT